jgi:hypothetical protein
MSSRTCFISGNMEVIGKGPRPLTVYRRTLDYVPRNVVGMLDDSRSLLQDPHALSTEVIRSIEIPGKVLCRHVLTSALLGELSSQITL